MNRRQGASSLQPAHNPTQNVQLPPNFQVTATAQQTIYSGPVVHPEIAYQWEAVCPGAADRILTQFEQQAAHRQSLETSLLTMADERERLGQKLAFVLFFLAIVGGIVLVALDKPISGIVLLIGALITPTAIFIAGRQGAIKELNKKSKAVADAATDANANTEVNNSAQ